MDIPSVDEESALNVFGRAIGKQEPLVGLNNLLFSTGPHPKEVIEITGDAGSGKSYIVLDLIAKCILPGSFQGSAIGGMECGVVLLNSDHHFNMFRLVRIMEVRVRRRLKSIVESQVEEMILLSLQRLGLISFFSDEERNLALIAAKNHMCLSGNVGLVVMDSISAHYWSEVAKGGTRKMDLFVAEILRAVHHILGSFSFTFAYTRPSFFFSKSGLPSPLSTSYDLRNINTRIKLKRRFQADEMVTFVEVHAGSNVRIVFYKLCENGIEWSK